MKRIITDEVVAEEHAAGRRRIAAPPSTTVVTPAAWTKAQELGVELDRADHRARAQQRTEPKRPPEADKGSAERIVDASGLMVVRGRSVRLGTFTGAGPDRHVGLTDLVTGEHGAPMTAGIMSWSREDSFPWTLDYFEIDYVLEGVLQIEIDGRTLEGRTGDVFYIPRGSRIVFGTPSRVRVFYVTYPADWQASK